MKKLLLTLTIAASVIAGSAVAEHHGDKGKHKRPKFVEIDANGDGKVTKEEALSFKRKRVEEKVNKHFPEADANGDGVLSPEEFKAHKKERKEHRKERRQERRDNR